MSQHTVTCAAVQIGLREIKIWGDTYELPGCSNTHSTWRRSGNMGNVGLALQPDKEHDSLLLSDLMTAMNEAGMSTTSIFWNHAAFSCSVWKLPQAMRIVRRVLKHHGVITRWFRRSSAPDLEYIQKVGSR